MNYENKPCPACGTHMHEEDDIVVCPECATPQHRSCWMENGKCVNDAKHSEGYIWSPDEKEEIFEAPPTIQEDNGLKICPACNSETPSDVRYCGRCGFDFEAKYEPNNEKHTIHCDNCGLDNEDATMFCSRCGAPLPSSPVNPTQARPTQNGYKDFMLDEKIGKHTVAEYAVYVRQNVRKYVDSFYKIEVEGKKFTFNWAAFFLGPLWYFYRKIYKAGFALIVCIAAVSLVFGSCSNEIAPYYEKMNEINADTTISEEEKLEQLSDLSYEIWDIVAVPTIVSAGLYLVISFVSALLANKIYYKKIVSDFAIIDREVEDKNIQAMLVHKRGGVSALNAFLAIFVYNAVGNVMLWLADYVVKFF